MQNHSQQMINGHLHKHVLVFIWRTSQCLYLCLQGDSINLRHVLASEKL